MLNQKWILFFGVFIVPILAKFSDIPMPNMGDITKKSNKLPPCKLCTVLVDSFKKGMEKTERGNHDEGDAAWVRERLKTYRNSEVRFVEIQESLCKGIGRGEDQCHALFEDVEHDIEDWWSKHQDIHPDLHNWLCVEQTAVCCPPNHFGANCDQCTDCNGNGVCKGNGTRKGNGKCLCDNGYSGETCNECALQFYESFRDENKLLCTACNAACKKGTGCTGAGPKGCLVCEDGWTLDPDNGGCIDVNECASTKHKCTQNQFCVNSEGSYRCMECDKSCNGCSGDGPDLCDTCADGFELREGLCKDVSNEKRQQNATFYRYLTYLGLCIATCAIFQSSTWIASIIGLAVACYITVSEYWLTTLPPQSSGVQPLEDFLQKD